MWVDKLLLVASWRVFTREWLTFIPLVWPNCIPVLLLPLERDSELLRERESVLRLRERRWLDGASFDNERGSTSKEGEPNLDKKNTPVQSPVSLGEDLQWWPDKVFEKNPHLFHFKWIPGIHITALPPPPKRFLFYFRFLYCHLKCRHKVMFLFLLKYK